MELGAVVGKPDMQDCTSRLYHQVATRLTRDARGCNRRKWLSHRTNLHAGTVDRRFQHEIRGSKWNRQREHSVVNVFFLLKRGARDCQKLGERCAMEARRVIRDFPEWDAEEPLKWTLRVTSIA